MKQTSPYQDFVHTGPGTLAGRFMRQFWQPIFRSDELRSGRAVPVRVMSEDFTLYRGETGEAHLLGFRCAHRSVQLSSGWVEGDSIRCLYHGWKYDASGQCIEQPPEPKPFADKIRIASYPVREYIGLIFAFLGEGEPEPFPRLERFEDPKRTLWVTGYERNCNYFQNIENTTDICHVPFTHRRSFGFKAIEMPRLSVAESPWGIEYWVTLANGSKLVTQYGMPNRAYIAGKEGHGTSQIDTEAIIFKVPIDDTRHYALQVRSALLSDGAKNLFTQRLAEHDEAVKGTVPTGVLCDRILEGKLALDDVPVDQTGTGLSGEYAFLEDDVSQIGQGVIVDRSQEHLGQSDVGVALTRRLWERELQALAEGRPLRKWTRAPGLVPGGSWVTKETV